jgi:neutral amino acid transport system substrate-binding protein
MSQPIKFFSIKPSVAFCLALTTIITGLVSAGCEKQGSETTTSETPATPSTPQTNQSVSQAGGLKLGTLVPSTGDLASIGQYLPIAANLAVETVNACGGVNGSPVTLVNEDDQTDPAAGAIAMTKLAEVDKVAGVVGSFASSVSSAAVDIAVRNKVMLVSPGSTSPVFTDRAKKGEFQGFWARTAPPDTYQAKALAELAHKKGFKNVSTVVINNDYGIGFEREFQQAFEKLGGKILTAASPVRYDPKAATLDSEAAAAFKNKPDAVAAVLYAETGSVLLKAAFEQGLSEGVTVLMTDGVYSEDFIKQVGKTADGKSILAGALGTVPAADGQALEKFTTLWKEKTSKEVTAYVPHGWDAAILMMLAAQASKENSGTGIQSKIREVANAPGQEVTDPCEAMKLVASGQDINYQGASGNVDIDEYGDVIGSYDVWTVEPDGKLQVVDRVKLN